MHFILISGAWHGAWCWERVAALLEAKGHRVQAPDLRGMGADRTPLAAVSFQDWATAVARVARASGEPVVLVGHSRGGIVVSQAAELAPEAIHTSVYLAAALVPDGLRMADVFATARTDPAVAAGVRLRADGVSTDLDPALLPTHFYNTTPPELLARAISRLTPEPVFSNAAVMQLSPEKFGRVRRAYVECLQNRCVPIELQRKMQDALPCQHVGVLDTDHSPFYSAPEALAEALIAAAPA